MKFSQFCRPSYSPRSIIAGSERTVNFFTEVSEPANGKAQYTLYRTPGLGLFCDTALAAPVRAVFALNGHTYWVVGTHFIEVFAGGTFTDYSVISGIFLTDDGKPACIAGNPTQQFITSGGNGYIAEGGGVHLIAAAGFPAGNAGRCAFQDGYFLVLIKDSQQFQVSGLNDGNAWDPTDISSEESRPDFGVSIISDHEQVWIAGTETIQVFTDTGAVFPFEADVSAVIQQGILAPATLVQLDNSVFWVGGDRNGHGVVWRADGYTPKRISDHAVENRIQGYGDISDAIAMVFQMSGHMFMRISFPSANDGRGATEQLDVSTGQWVETPYWNALGFEESHRAQVCCFAFNKILAGDRANGKIYELSMDFLDDDGDVIRRLRRAPHIYAEKKQIVYHELILDGNVGIGVQDAAALGYDPKLSLSWSDSGGKGNWGNERFISAGKQGRYGTIMNTFNLGVGRDRVFEVVVTDPVDWCFTDASFDATVLQN